MHIRKILAACAAGIVMMGVATATMAADVRMFVRHEVSDYAAWRKDYNTFLPVQKKHGVIFQAVYQSADDPNDVTVIHDFRSLEAARAFVALPELKAAMEKSGVKGAPTVWFTTRSAK